MIDRTEPIRLLEQQALVLRNRNERRLWKSPHDIRQIRQIKPPMTRRDKPQAQLIQQRQMQPIDMGVNHVKARGLLRRRFEQRAPRGIGVRPGTSEAQRAWPDRDKVGARL